MKKRANKNHKREPILEKEVLTPNGKYHLKLVKATETPFNSSFDFTITHVNPGILELMLNEDEEVWPDACHDYEDTYPGYGKTIFQKTTPHKIGYDNSKGQFYVQFYQDVNSESRGETPGLPRTKHFPIPETTYRNVKNYFKKIGKYFKK